MISITVFYTCVYSLVTETAQQHELPSTNFEILLLYPKGFCDGENKFFLITTEVSPCHYFCSYCLFLFIGSHQHNVSLPTAAGFVRYLRFIFATCLYIIHSILHTFFFPFASALEKHYWYTIIIVFPEISWSINNWWKKYPFHIISIGVKKVKCIWTDT